MLAREDWWIKNKYDRVLPTHPAKRIRRKARKIDAHNMRGSHGNKHGCRAVVAMHWDGRERQYESIIDAAETLGVSRHIISNCIHGRSRSVGGYTFKYDKEAGK